ncbi:MAG TPA: serine hydrolase domain-containing protein [Nocardioidaceae bacterium]|nr:serine hydrolase domain-containing protein [Nocardioidaceae bacterium]
MQGRDVTNSSTNGTATDAGDWQRRLDELVAKVDAPGAVFGFQRGDERLVIASGTANLDTGQPMTPETLFPVASVSKVYTATLAMQLVDDGLLDLDRPIRDVLPDFRVADDRASKDLTARHLLTHTSGLDGDKFDAFGRGDDALARYVEDCASLGQVHDVGATFSYCNSGMLIMGRIIEVLRGKTFEAALQDHVLDPLGATKTGMLPEDLIWRPLAAGHIKDESETLAVFHHWEGERSHGPAGGVVTNVVELMDFARLHMDDGVAPNGTRLLSEASAKAMVAPEITVPNPYEEATHWSLGWELSRRPDEPMLVSHGGDLLAHHARFVTCPEAELTLCLLINGDGGDRIADALFPQLLTEAGVTPYQPPKPPETPPQVDLDRAVGTYQTPAIRIRLEAAGDHLDSTLTVISEQIAELLPPAQRERRQEMLPIEDDFYVMRPDDDGDPWLPVVFYESGGQHYLHTGLRAVRRTSGGQS